MNGETMENVENFVDDSNAAAAAEPQQESSDTTAEATPPVVVVNGKEVKYFFKTDKIKDDEGKVIGEGRKHPDVVAILPMPSVAEVIEQLTHYGETTDDDKEKKLTPGAKVAALIMDSIQDLIVQAGRAQINAFLEADPKATFTATNFDLSRLTLAYVSTLEKGQRGVWSPGDEELKAFNDDYTNVFVHLVHYDPKKVKVHCDNFLKGFAKVKSDKIAVRKLHDFLTVWASKTTEDSMNAHAETYEWLLGKAKKYLEAEEKNFADAL